MRRFMMWFAIGGFTGAVVATLIAPWALQTFLSTTGAKDAMCQCSELVANTTSSLITTQLVGAAIGAVLFPTCAFLFKRKRGDAASAGSADAGATASGEPR